MTFKTWAARFLDIASFKGVKTTALCFIQPSNTNWGICDEYEPSPDANALIESGGLAYGACRHCAQRFQGSGG